MRKRFFITAFSILLVFLLCNPVRSNATGAAGDGASGSQRGLSLILGELRQGLEYSVRFLTSGTYQDPADSSQNPDNAFLKMPRYLADLELRPDLSLRFRTLDLGIKPRMRLEWMAWEDGVLKGDTYRDDEWYVNEWHARFRLAETLFVSYGRENLQWGPSYLFSPSNPFFRDNGRSNPKREVAGMDFARLVWLPSTQWTISLIANPAEGRQEFPVREFNRAYAAKLDYSGSEAYASTIFSYTEHDRGRIGAFAGLTASDALLLYCEGNISRGTNALYPEKSTNPFGASMEPVGHEDSSLEFVFLAGGSYTLLTGPTLTAEYVHNSPGYSDNQAKAYYLLRERASGAYSIPGSIRDLAGLILGRTADPGLRFLRRDYFMFQFSQNDIRDRLNLLFRWTRNLDDGSGRFISIAECFLGDHTQAFSIATFDSGKQDTEFGSILDCQWMIGLEYTF